MFSLTFGALCQGRIWCPTSRTSLRGTRLCTSGPSPGPSSPWRTSLDFWATCFCVFGFPSGTLVEFLEVKLKTSEKCYWNIMLDKIDTDLKNNFVNAYKQNMLPSKRTRSFFWKRTCCQGSFRRTSAALSINIQAAGRCFIRYPKIMKPWYLWYHDIAW